MSYDANPFADPEAANPFSDPAVQQNTWNQQQQQGGLEDFNPFDANNAQTQSTQPPVPPPQAAVPTQPAVMQAVQEPPPPYTPQSAAQIGTDDLKRRQEELERKAEELQRKEQELQRSMGHQARVNNFPPLPKKCCVQPCFYQDFELDIPMEFQRIVRTVYYVWIAYVCLLFLNVIGALAYFISAPSGGGPGTTFGVSILYLVLFTPCSFVCWYRPLYKAFRSDSSFNFFLFFFIFFFQFCVCIIQSLGISGWGTVGFITGLAVINTGVGVFMLIIGLLFAGLAAVNIILLIRVHRIYRSTGASFAKAQQEFAQGVMSNKTVQKTAAEAGAAAARGAVSNQFGSTDNRY